MGELKKKYKYGIFLLSFLIGHSVIYFLLQKFVTRWNYISLPIDYKIPFVKFFVIPYVLWYVYVVVVFLYLLIVSTEEFEKAALLFLIGDILSLMIYIIYPTAIDFRPDTIEGSGALLELVRVIYMNDRPVNVCPSLHCYVSLVMNLAILKTQYITGVKGIIIKTASTIFAFSICLSTFFIKQHSVIDFVVALIMVICLYPIAYLRKKHNN